MQPTLIRAEENPKGDSGRFAPAGDGDIAGYRLHVLRPGSV
jgi:hypothetical protein